MFRELTEGKGAYFPPDNSEAMAAVIGDVLSKGESQEKLVAYGNERVQAFTFRSSPPRSSRFIASSLTVGSERCPAAIIIAAIVPYSTCAD